VLRSTFGIGIVIAASLLVIYFTADAVLRGAWGFAVAALPWQLLGLWVVYLVLVRPCVIVTPDALTIVNVGRVHDLPWSAITEIVSGYQLSAVLGDGRRITSWGAPSIGLDRPSVSGDRSRMRTNVEAQRAASSRAQGIRTPVRRQRTPQLTASGIIENARDRWERTAAPARGALLDAGARTRWDRFGILVLAGLVVWCAVTAAIVATLT
jgi:hypothetical protein